MTGFGVNVEADVHVTSGQMDDEVRVVIHWKRCTELVTMSCSQGTLQLERYS